MQFKILFTIPQNIVLQTYNYKIKQTYPKLYTFLQAHNIIVYLIKSCHEYLFVVNYFLLDKKMDHDKLLCLINMFWICLYRYEWLYECALQDYQAQLIFMNQ